MVKSSLGIQELHSDGSNRYYSIVLPESIESLTPGAKVYYKGMYVGSVTKVYLIEATQMTMVSRIRPKSTLRLNLISTIWMLILPHVRKSMFDQSWARQRCTK